MVFARLIEKLTGRPHRHDNAQLVKQAAGELRRDVGKLSSMLRPYMEADDPLVALMTDLFNQRQMRAGNGPRAQ
ncbi:hypothetical protein [Bradyrhizobium paxllaeri]|uniref:hypothetical protein n=1 Tax=Bradyrhizobium paxllaeri TaxID=190148 RepID=UPI000810ACD6|nr:hypothetical protein [Bradyrhizobium paxllaeri]